jgi:tetratricopeptide (TPR) repeat protein
MDEQRFQHAISLRDAGKFEDAACELGHMAEGSPDPPEKGLILLNQAVCLSHVDTQLGSAKKLLREASILLGGDRGVRALVEFTDASFYMGLDPKTALAKLDSISRNYSDVLRRPEERGLYGETQLRRGLLLVELKRYRKARPILEEVLALDVEKNGEFYFSLGLCYLALRETEPAGQQFREALHLGLAEQKLVDCHFYLGVVDFRTKAYAKALQEFEFCRRNHNKTKLPAKTLYKWLAATCTRLFLTDDAERYRQLSDKA